MGVEQLRIARVEPLRFVKVTLALAANSPRCRTSAASNALPGCRLGEADAPARGNVPPRL